MNMGLDFLLMQYKIIKVAHSFRRAGAVALTVGSVPRRIVPKLRHFHWLKMNNELN